MIKAKSENDPMGLSMDHVPPRQFYMKQIRATQNLNLDVAPSHKNCNEAYKEDEEYFNFQCIHMSPGIILRWKLYIIKIL